MTERTARANDNEPTCCFYCSSGIDECRRKNHQKLTSEVALPTSKSESAYSKCIAPDDFVAQSSCSGYEESDSFDWAPPPESKSS